MNYTFLIAALVFIALWVAGYLVIDLGVYDLSKRRQDELLAVDKRAFSLGWEFVLIFLTPFVAFEYFPLIKGDLKAVLVAVPMIFTVAHGYASWRSARKLSLGHSVERRVIIGYTIYIFALSILMAATKESWAIRIWY